MKKIIAVLLIIVLTVFPLFGCELPTEIDKEAVEVKYTAAYDNVETDYVYQYNWYIGEYVLLPDTRTVHHDEKYEIKYKIIYDDESVEYEWQTVDKETYEKARDKLPP